MAWLLVMLASGLVACDDVSKDTSGCEKDSDCKGARICDDGDCVAPDDDDDGSSKKKSAKRTDDDGGGTEDASKEEAADAAFRTVPTGSWEKRIGPRMKAGAKVVHQVFEGPFGPSPASLFAVTKRTNGHYYVLVVGEDGKGWPAGPLAPVEDIPMPGDIKAVSFFDADGNGTTDALVLVSWAAPNGVAHDGILLEWTDRGMRRLLALEPKLDGATSVAAARKVLGR